MPKFLLLSFFLMTITVKAQSHSGLSLGYLSAYPDAKTSTGFYAGFYHNAQLSSDISLEPSINYARAGSADLLYLPVMLKLYWPGTDYNFQIGPQGTYILDDFAEASDRLVMDINVGLGYDLVYNVFIQARYGFKVVDAAEAYPPSDFNTLMIGVGLSF